MNVLPVTIWESIKNPSSRFVYDNMLKVRHDFVYLIVRALVEAVFLSFSTGIC